MGKRHSQSFQRFVAAYKDGLVSDEMLDSVLQSVGFDQESYEKKRSESPLFRKATTREAPERARNLEKWHGRKIDTANGTKFVVDGGPKDERYDSVTVYSYPEGKPLFVARQDDEKDFVVYGSDVISKKYDEIGSVCLHDGKPLFVAARDGQRVVVFGGEIVSQEYDDIFDLERHEEKLLYRAVLSETESMIVWGDEVFGKEFDTVYDPSICAGKPIFTARRGEKEFVVHGDKIVSKKYEHVEQPTLHKGKPLFVAKNMNEREFIVWGDHESRFYDKVTYVKQSDDGFMYEYYEDGTYYEVTVSTK